MKATITTHTIGGITVCGATKTRQTTMKTIKTAAVPEKRKEGPKKRSREASWSPPVLSAQVLIYEPALQRSVWVDVRHRKRSKVTLEAALDRDFRDGKNCGYRLFSSRVEVYGLESHPRATYP